MTSPGLCLYLHVPWCVRRCGYCDFNTYVVDTTDPGVTAPYVAGLLAEIRVAGRRLGDRTVETIYFGGGTPTLMAPADAGRLLAAIRDEFTVADDAEITTEANPESVSPAHLEQLRAAGVNRLSLGMQSGVPSVLATLDRLHTPGKVTEAVGWARAAGFDNLSLDLIYGTPGESPADWQTTLDAALALAPDHVSAYSLIVEDGTPLARRMAAGALPYPDEDDLADEYATADAAFAQAGLTWYEVSNWARPGRECRHNLAYWRSGDWWGLGAGAHSHIAGVRWWNPKHPATYIARATAATLPEGSEQLTEQQRHWEAIMLGLRLAEGVAWTALTPAEQGRAAAYLQSGHLVRRENRLTCTPAGRLIADGIVRAIVE